MQYGIKIKSGEFHSMGWDEFTDLLAGLNETTPLVRVAQIRLESDPEALKQFTKEQRRMNTEWKNRNAKKRSKKDVEAFLADMQTAFSKMFGETAEE